MMRLLITGGAGFIGSNFIHYLFNKYPDYRIINYDKLTYAGNLENLTAASSNPHYQFVKGDICDAKILEEAIQNHQINVIVNFAAETHVDRSITFAGDFIQTDVYGTYVLLEMVKKYKLERFIQIGTDEVYGDRDGKNPAQEDDSLHPGSPYAASKAGADLQILAARRTYNLPVMITRCTNNYGPYQYPEKMLPLFITNLLENKKVPVYGEGGQIRDWLYVSDHCSAIDHVLHQGIPGEIYNIGANQNPEVSNLALTRSIVKLLNKGEAFIEYVKDRPGHDRRYAVNCNKIKKLGWCPAVALEEGLKNTIQWYQDNPRWWQKIKSGEFKQYYQKQYGGKS